ncbi:cupin domain-containing protein [Dokdonia ponticola]|uniref:Cupin domain-containing protein n=1 Tax=Dokdonia ponticola TaxID=2041041 RepID=A0ABV9I132_9FLAO
MEVTPLTYPEKEYLKYIIQKKEDGVAIDFGTVILKKGHILPFKTLHAHEISYLVSGKLKVYTKDGNEKIMSQGDLVYLNKDEIRKTETLEHSKIMFFLFKKI